MFPKNTKSFVSKQKQKSKSTIVPDDENKVNTNF